MNGTYRCGRQVIAADGGEDVHYDDLRVGDYLASPFDSGYCFQVVAIVPGGSRVDVEGGIFGQDEEWAGSSQFYRLIGPTPLD